MVFHLVKCSISSPPVIPVPAHRWPTAPWHGSHRRKQILQVWDQVASHNTAWQSSGFVREVGEVGAHVDPSLQSHYHVTRNFATTLLAHTWRLMVTRWKKVHHGQRNEHTPNHLADVDLVHHYIQTKNINTPLFFLIWQFAMGGLLR